MLDLTALRTRRIRHAPYASKLSPRLQRQGRNGAPPKRHAATVPAPDGGRKPGAAPPPATSINQGKRIVALVQLAKYQMEHPSLRLNEVDKATWKVLWLCVIFVLLTARAMLLVVDLSDDQALQRSIVSDLIVYARKQAASIHSRNPRRQDVDDQNAAIWGTYLG